MQSWCGIEDLKKEDRTMKIKQYTDEYDTYTTKMHFIFQIIN